MINDITNKMQAVKVWCNTGELRGYALMAEGDHDGIKMFVFDEPVCSALNLLSIFKMSWDRACEFYGLSIRGCETIEVIKLENGDFKVQSC